MLDFDQITDHLYVGSRPDPDDWHILAALRVTVNISLQAESQDRFTGAAPEVHLWLPTPDWFGPGVEAIQITAEFIDQMVRSNRKVYLHCNMGIGRAPTAAVGYLIATGMTLDEALDWLRTRRPHAKPNSDQLRQLSEFTALREKQGRS